MAKSTFKNFASLASVKTTADVADLETPIEVSTTETEPTSTISVDGEDLGDLNDTPSVVVERLSSTEESVEDEQTAIEDERAEEDSTSLNDESEDEDEDIAPPAPTLNERDVQSWTTDELEAYITGEVDVEVYHSTVVKAINEHRIRVVGLDNAWTLEECKAFLTNGLTPAKTSKGAWVKDVTRQYRREHEWTTQELESWALGEIQPEGTTLAAGLAIELKQRLNLVVPSVDVDAVITCYKHASGQAVKPVVLTQAPTAKTQPVTEARVAEVKEQIKYEGLTEMNQSYIEGSLAAFHRVMAPGKAITPAIGGEAQKLLKEVITYAITLTDPVASRSAMTLLFNHFKENRAPGKVFEDTYAFRFIENMRSTVKEQESHAALLTLFLAYADPMIELRAQTDVGSLIKGVPSQYQSRVFEFFSKV